MPIVPFYNACRLPSVTLEFAIGLTWRRAQSSFFVHAEATRRGRLGKDQPQSVRFGGGSALRTYTHRCKKPGEPCFHVARRATVRAYTGERAIGPTLRARDARRPIATELSNDRRMRSIGTKRGALAHGPRCKKTFRRCLPPTRPPLASRRGGRRLSIHFAPQSPSRARGLWLRKRSPRWLRCSRMRAARAPSEPFYLQAR